jgi:hypothetical protein
MPGATAGLGNLLPSATTAGFRHFAATAATGFRDLIAATSSAASHRLRAWLESQRAERDQSAYEFCFHVAS